MPDSPNNVLAPNSPTKSDNQNQSNQTTNPSQQNQQNQQTQTQTQTQTQPNIILNETLTGDGYIVTNNQTTITDQSVNTNTTFNTTDPTNHVPQIREDLKESVEYNYDDNIITESDNLVNEIRTYATQIKCEDFHGKGSIDDYTELFRAASNIANETRQMQLDIDIDGFNDFGRAADELSELFNNFTKRLQNINIINDTSFLRAVLDALKKVANLSDVFGRFKKTILITSEIKVPKTAHDTKIVLVDVMDEINCAINYINNFVVPDPNLVKAKLSDADRNIINKAVSTIDNWQTLCDQGVSIALTNSTDMQYLKQANIDLKNKTSVLKSVTSSLKSKLATMNFN
jgi:hypothetical protein